MEGLSYRIMVGSLLMEAKSISYERPPHNAQSGLIKVETFRTKYFHTVNHEREERTHTLYTVLFFCLKCVKS